MPAVVTSAPMSKAAAMTLYSERRRRTAVLNLDSSASRRRTDIVAALTTAVDVRILNTWGSYTTTPRGRWSFVMRIRKKMLVDSNM